MQCMQDILFALHTNNISAMDFTRIRNLANSRLSLSVFFLEQPGGPLRGEEVPFFLFHPRSGPIARPFFLLDII